MAYSERLASRVRALVSDRDDVDEQRVFGGLTFMVGTVVRDRRPARCDISRGRARKKRSEAASLG